jgi:hypothetical protein
MNINWNEAAWKYKGYTPEEREAAEFTFRIAELGVEFMLWYQSIFPEIKYSTPVGDGIGFYTESDQTAMRALTEYGWSEVPSKANAVGRRVFDHPESDVKIMRAEGAFVVLRKERE